MGDHPGESARESGLHRGDHDGGAGAITLRAGELTIRRLGQHRQRAERRLGPCLRRLHGPSITLVASHFDANTARNSAGILNVFGSVNVLGGIFNRGTYTSTGANVVNNTPDDVAP